MRETEDLGQADERLFALRLERSAADLFGPLRKLYGDPPGFEDALLALLRRKWEARPAVLKDLDLRRDLMPDWFLSEKAVGYVFYVDRFAGALAGVLDHLDHLESLGVTYVHFMPCLKPRPGNSDGGYSVMDYRAIDPRLGTMDDFERVAGALRARGMDVCIDLVLNHTAKEHDWAVRARAGDRRFQNYYRMFETDEEPRVYERTLLEIFPDDAPGNFTWYPEFGRWVWTTFNEHQWDLNWSNPEVFLEIVDIMLDLANRGATCLRLDAVALLWKRQGTNCQNQPEVHDILQALRAATRIAAPALIHKAEAIVAPKDLVPYLGAGRTTGREANLAYHNNLMVQFWSSLATRDTRLMTYVLKTHFPESFRNAAFATYIRCHDDIGWAITEEDADAVGGISGPGHRRFLADFYAGRFPGGFARGAVFQSNPLTGDRRTSGSFASLAGLEAAREAGDAEAVGRAVERILMGHALIAAFAGMPLLYMGDEIGLTNDHAYVEVPDHANDNRWLHRPAMDWSKVAAPDPAEARILDGVRRIMRRRKSTPELAGAVPTRVLVLDNPTVFGFARLAETGPLVCLFNFSEVWQRVDAGLLAQAGVTRFHDRLGEGDVALQDGFVPVAPYGRLWLE